MRKTVILCIALAMLTLGTEAQTLIATSSYPNATANHNQRKIVRDLNDNIYVVFVDRINLEKTIKGVKFDQKSKQWSNAIPIAKGDHPTLSISRSGEIHLVFESDESVRKIKHSRTTDFINWTPETTISDSASNARIPVADIDKSGNLNVLWIQENDGLTSSLIYARIQADTLTLKKTVTTQKEINDIAIANHLQYYSDVLIFALQHSTDSLQFFRTTDSLASFDTIYSARGSQPCISYNSFNGGDLAEESSIRMLYLDTLSQLVEVESTVAPKNNNQLSVRKLSSNQTSYLCIDDVQAPIGYSFLFMQHENLYHGFSCGAECGWYTLLDTIQGNPLFPSLAYKTFSYDHIDFVWMKNNGNGYDIFYKREDKYRQVGIRDDELGKGFSVTGYPNPFTDRLTISITTVKQKENPVIEIYNTNSQLIQTLIGRHTSSNHYSLVWDGTNQKNEKVTPGMYILLCRVGQVKTARKVFYAE